MQAIMGTYLLITHYLLPIKRTINERFWSLQQIKMWSHLYPSSSHINKNCKTGSVVAEAMDTGQVALWVSVVTGSFNTICWKTSIPNSKNRNTRSYSSFISFNLRFREIPKGTDVTRCILKLQMIIHYYHKEFLFWSSWANKLIEKWWGQGELERKRG